MARWTGTWLSGVGAALPDSARESRWRGDRLGLPASGPGSVAGTGTRLIAFVLDLAAGALIGGLVNAVVTDPSPGLRALAANSAFALEVLLLTALTGQTIGMRLAGIGVVRLADRGGVPGFLPAAIRTALLLLLVPALIFDRDARGLHDKAAGTVVLRTRAGGRAGAPEPNGSRPSA